jgi:hypothetical protein
MRSFDMNEMNIEIIITRAEALVLFEFLAKFDDTNTLHMSDSSEAKVLLKLLGELESKLVEPFYPNYLEILEAARASLRDPDEYETED